ncbi:hypothetical protein M431DRAFT_281561 [Trichoderma harzianum CBS 226.95]|uniref:Uncharacterized protein n=1 Tax=Trichoderma harzianum CBS 226.95 TaxID=983964 RepID=A0A2T4ANG5_TRIHA|nr:hypothetical protein M431DRAFT_281561 [Trichoderma harzianum CBS 226.95]PTB58626.1 hypothetical protein M431DRAFT_281561 [Trichoderma harzianum CBS 226.95]
MLAPRCKAKRCINGIPFSSLLFSFDGSILLRILAIEISDRLLSLSRVLCLFLFVTDNDDIPRRLKLAPRCASQTNEWLRLHAAKPRLSAAPLPWTSMSGISFDLYIFSRDESFSSTTFISSGAGEAA